MKIAVTGANGHVGINLINELLVQGHQVKALIHKNEYGLKKLTVETVKGDLLSSLSLIPLVKDVDVVIHLAARISIEGDPDGIVRKINVDGTRNIVEASLVANVKKFIHFSSIHAFQQEPHGETLDEKRPLVTDNAFAYDRSKADGERIVMDAVNKGLNALVLSPTAIIGPADHEPSLIGKAMLELYNHQIPALVPGGYNWVDVRDVVQGCIAAIENGHKGEKYLLSGTWHSLRDVVSLITKYTGIKTVSMEMPFWLARVGLPFITLYSKISKVKPLYTSESLHIISHGSRNISNEKARRELNFAPRDLDQTVKDLFSWFREYGFI